LIDGLIIAACFPSTTTTCVVLTRAAHGDEAASLFSALLSNIIGVFLSPFLVSMYLASSDAEVPFVELIIGLVLMVLLPIAVGQIILNILTRYKQEHQLKKIPSSIISNGVILFVVFTIFSDAFSEGSPVPPLDWISITSIVTVSYLLFCVASFFGSSLPFFDFNRKERIGLLYCSTHKTLGMGIPIINGVYQGDPNRYLALLPIMIYHPLQLVLGSVVASPLDKWAQKDPKAQVQS
jgi:sodium/bile acid cotransporter 7